MNDKNYRMLIRNLRLNKDEEINIPRTNNRIRFRKVSRDISVWTEKELDSWSVKQSR